MKAALRFPDKTISFDRDKVGQWVCDQLGTKFFADDSAAIGLVYCGDIVAGFLYDNYNGRSVCMHVAAMGKGWLRDEHEFLRIAFDYPFAQLGVIKVIGRVDSVNAASWKFGTRIGFKHEATITDAGKDGDLLLYTLVKNDCTVLGD